MTSVWDACICQSPHTPLSPASLWSGAGCVAGRGGAVLLGVLCRDMVLGLLCTAVLLAPGLHLPCHSSTACCSVCPAVSVGMEQLESSVNRKDWKLNTMQWRDLHTLLIIQCVLSDLFTVVQNLILLRKNPCMTFSIPSSFHYKDERLQQVLLHRGQFLQLPPGCLLVVWFIHVELQKLCNEPEGC